MGSRLTDPGVRGLEAPAKGSKVYFDDGVKGFGVRVTANGAKAFVLDYRVSGRQRRMTIGEFPTWSVVKARKEAKTLRRQVDGGDDPLQMKRDKRDAADALRNAPTFGRVVEDYIQRYQIGTKGNVSAPEVRRTLLRECAHWLDRPIATIEPRKIRHHLEAMRDGTALKSNTSSKPRPVLANRTFAYLHGLFRWSAEPGIDYIERSPCEGLRRPYDGEESRDRWFNDDEITRLWIAAEELAGYPGAYLKLLLLTGKRKRALAQMRHEELDLEQQVWTPPRDPRRRRRNKRVHAVPLPALATRILKGLGSMEMNPYVFVGRHGNGHLDPGTPLQRRIQRLSGVVDFNFHAIRHTVETRLGELGVPPHIRDMALDHAPARGAGAGYDHYDYQSELRDAFGRWAGHVSELVAPDGVELFR